MIFFNIPAWAMGGKVEISDSDSDSISDVEEDCKQEDIQAFVTAFSKCKRFREAGMSLIIDHSGRIAKRPTIKDLCANKAVILACVEGSLGRKVQTPQLSAYTVQKAILAEYRENKRFPEGLTAQVPSVRDWALRCGAILKKCVSKFRRLAKRAKGAKMKTLFKMKEAARKIGWPNESTKESPQGGHHLDLTELPDSSAVSEARALSDLSTSASSVVSSKMARVAKQLESLKLSGGTTKSVMKTCEQHAGDPPLLDLPAVGATCNPQDTVALILARAKERRLSKENQKPEDVAPSSSDAPLDRKSVPAFVFRALEANRPSTFPLNAQYVKTMKTLEAEGGEDEDSESCEVVEAKPDNTRKRKAEKPEWKYSEIKNTFISSLKKDGLKHPDAVAKWNESEEKKQLLGSISLAELKKRRFVDKSCESNPWA